MKRLVDFPDGVLPDGVTVSYQYSYDSDEIIIEARYVCYARHKVNCVELLAEVNSDARVADECVKAAKAVTEYARENAGK